MTAGYIVYVATARRVELAKHCKFGTTLSKMLRDHLFCVINHEAIQKKLLDEKYLTYVRDSLQIGTGHRGCLKWHLKPEVNFY